MCFSTSVAFMVYLVLILEARDIHSEKKNLLEEELDKQCRYCHVGMKSAVLLPIKPMV